MPAGDRHLCALVLSAHYLYIIRNYDNEVMLTREESYSAMHGDCNELTLIQGTHAR